MTKQLLSAKPAAQKGVLASAEARQKQAGVLKMERFWSKVKKTPSCWEWIGSKDKNGYGSFRFKGHSRLAHRVSWLLNGGLIPHGLFLCHKCDNPSCVRPTHLFLGNQSDNMGDAKRKGRMPSGEKSSMRLHPDRIARGTRRWNAKLTDKIVLEIRGAAAAGWSFKTLATKFHVDRSQISRIAAGKRWKHVGGARSQKEC